MNPDLLDALGAVAMDCWFDALQEHPYLLAVRSEAVIDEEHALVLVLTSIERLLEALDGLAGETDGAVACLLSDWDDIPF